MILMVVKVVVFLALFVWTLYLCKDFFDLISMRKNNRLTEAGREKLIQRIQNLSIKDELVVSTLYLGILMDCLLKGFFGVLMPLIILPSTFGWVITVLTGILFLIHLSGTAQAFMFTDYHLKHTTYSPKEELIGWVKIIDYAPIKFTTKLYYVVNIAIALLCLFCL